MAQTWDRGGGRDANMIPLPQITAMARAGAIEAAWALFEAAGYSKAIDNPAALAVKGRLLKDLAYHAPAADMAALMVDAACAYLAADTLTPEPYLLINAAACHALAGNLALAKAEALVVLARLDPGSRVNETPYWRAATRAEAQLICGNVGEADEQLGAAVAINPAEYDDRAATLRQLGRLIAAAGGDATWLDKHRPPASLHFAGHLGVEPDYSPRLREGVDAVLAIEQVGFGFGALAAGADMIIAESLIARGAELHVVLPATVPDFRAISVTPYGADWTARFEMCLLAAASVRIATDVGADQFEPLATAFAAELAMGSAMLNARQIEGRAVQLLVIDEAGGAYGGGALTARDGATWAQTGQAQHLITAPRSALVPSSSRAREGRPDRRLMALIRVDCGGLESLSDADYASLLDSEIVPFEAAAATLPDQPAIIQPITNGRILAFANPATAASYARGLLALDTKLTIRIAGHYGLIHDHGSVLRGPALSLVDEIIAASVTGVLTVSDAFATALQIGGGTASAVYVGDTNSPAFTVPTRLFTVTV